MASRSNVPPVPIEVAATVRAVIEVAARHADRIVFAVGADEERLARSIDIARGAEAASGRDPDQSSSTAVGPLKVACAECDFVWCLISAVG